jgi:uncharacterized membrane protein YdfJ with MMPL/SSD domain
MHTFLERLGRFCARRHWYVIGVGLVIVVGLVARRGAFGGSFVNDYTVPGSASDKGLTVLTSEFPAQAGNAGQIVFAAPAGAKLSSSEDAVNQSVSNVSHLDHVLGATSPYATSSSPTVSSGGTIAYAQVNFDTATNNLDEAYLDQLHNAVKPATDAGLTVEYGGAAGQIANHPNDTKSEAIGLICALILLLIMFVFLLTRVHEAYVRGRGPHRSVAIGIGGTARVITTAAAVMVVVFASFLADTDPIVKMLAVGMAVSVLIDASVGRMVLVPAIMSLLGDNAWWVPRRLDKILPHIDIEGGAATAPGAEQRKPVSVGP